jgi:predicted house-cleaning NTP pyrophosphatase (Maf/HAM1 superfamily)
MTGHTALDQQQAALNINANHFQILHGAADGTEVTGHALTRKNATRILRHTDGTRHIVTTGVTVSLTTGSEVVTLDGTGIALTNRNTTHINLLTDSKDIDTNHITSLQGRQTISIDTEFLQT